MYFYFLNSSEQGSPKMRLRVLVLTDTWQNLYICKNVSWCRYTPNYMCKYISYTQKLVLLDYGGSYSHDYAKIRATIRLSQTLYMYIIYAYVNCKYSCMCVICILIMSYIPYIHHTHSIHMWYMTITGIYVGPNNNAPIPSQRNTQK